MQKGEKLAIEHHQLKLNAKTANQIATLLQKNGITTLQWAACGGGDNNIDDYIEVFENKGITLVHVPDGQSAIVVKDKDGNEYFFGVDKDRNLVLPEVHRLSIQQIVKNNYKKRGLFRNKALDIFGPTQHNQTKKNPTSPLDTNNTLAQYKQ